MANGKSYVDPLLTSFSQAWSNGDGTFIAEKVAPVINVQKKTGVYFTYDKANLRSPSNTVRTGRGNTPVAEYSTSQTSYGPLKEHDLKAPITKDEMDMYDNPLNPRQDTTSFLMEQLAIEKEAALAAVLANTSTITRNATLSGTSQWSDYANSAPFTNIQTGVDALRLYGLRAPNTAFMGYEVWSKLINHPDLLDRIKWSSLGQVTEALFLQLFAPLGITKLYVGGAVKNTADEGATDSLGFVWGKHFWLAYITDTPGIRQVNGAYTLVLNNGRYVDTWNDQDQKTDWIRVNDYYEQKVVGADAFYLIKDAVA